MNVLLVRPSYSRNPFILSNPSVAQQQIAAITPDNHNIKIFDESRGQINFQKEDIDLVGLSTTTTNAPRAYEIADEFRRRGKTVVLGGYHPTALPLEAKEHADAVVIGEAEITWPQLLKDVEENRLKPFYKNDKPVDPKLIPPPRRDLSERKLKVAAVKMTRGCPNGCKFCPITNTPFGNVYRERPLENVIEEIRNIKQKYIYFIDSSLTTNTNYSKGLFKELKNMDKKLTCTGNINVLKKDDEFLKLAKEAGCRTWEIGFESISQETIDNINKKTNIVKDYKLTVKKIHDYGMAVIGSFIFGFDEDTPDVFKNTLKTINEIELDIATFNILVPFPGTPLFKKFDRAGRILTKDWSKYSIENVVYQPKKMSVEELYHGTREVVKDYYSNNNLLRKLVNDHQLAFSMKMNSFVHFFRSKKIQRDLFKN